MQNQEIHLQLPQNGIHSQPQQSKYHWECSKLNSLKSYACLKHRAKRRRNPGKFSKEMQTRTKKFSTQRKKRGREMQQQNCTFLHCDCAGFEWEAVELFCDEKLSRKIVLALRCEKIHFFCSLRSIFRQHNFNYGCRMKNVVADFSCDIFFAINAKGNEKSFLTQLSINCSEKFCMLCKWNNSSSFGIIFLHSTVGRSGMKFLCYKVANLSALCWSCDGWCWHVSMKLKTFL